MVEEETKNEKKIEEQKELAETVEEKIEEVVEEVPEEEKEAAEKVEPSLREEKPEEEIIEERIYTIPLSKAWIAPPNKRAPRAIRIIKSFVTRHMKLKTLEEEEGEEHKKLVISSEVNEKIWRRGIEKPPRKIRVRAAKDKEGNITVYLAEGD